MITSGSGTGCSGVATFYDMAIMPSWGTYAATSYCFGISDQYSSIIIEDILMLAPWGWVEASQPLPAFTKNHIIGLYTTFNEIGGGTELRGGTIVAIGMPYIGQIFGCDNCAFERITTTIQLNISQYQSVQL